VTRPDLVIHAARAVAPDPTPYRPDSGAAIRATGERGVTVTVAGGVIASVGPLDPSVGTAGGSAGGPTVVELGDDVVLLPGLVDTHVHVNEPGRTTWEGFATATRAAAAGGVTTIVDMPLNSLPPTLDAESLAVKRAAAAGQCAIDVAFWGGAVPANLGRLGALLDAGVLGVKCFLPDSGVEEFPALSTVQLELAAAEVAAADGLLLVHAEDPGVLAAAPEPAGRSYARFLASRPAQAEDTAIATALAVARRTGVRLHVVHLSSATALPAIAAAKTDGVRVTVETCPHYLVLAAEQVPDGATEVKCCPPVRGAANRDALWAGLADGTIDQVVSDHSPCTADLKALDTGDFGLAWGGISSVQLGLPLVWTEARRRGHGLADVVRWMSSAPAALVRFGTKGGIRAGAAADLVAFAPDADLVVDPARLHHRNEVSPYGGARLTGVVRSTWLAGTLVTVPAAGGRLLAGGEA
jgi:allantoinase